jgi:hypothetical protein
MMAENHFQQHIEAYDHWKAQLIEAIEDLQAWLDEHDGENGEHALSIYEAIEALKTDRLNIAFVAEFSRGKTELINSIFFSDYQRRLLPSEAGRTTMCPTELFYDRDAESPYVRLLPIETRANDVSIAEYKHEPIHWNMLPLDTGSPEQMETALREVVRTKIVSREQAERLGLYSKELYPQVAEGQEPDEVEIPMWRHALISFPHPLLQQGLAILDTPGLNALGSEPELTLNMLPTAQAILFVLAADTGVTRSDLDVWKYYIESTRKSGRNKGIAVVLNKIDTLWDELKDEQNIRASIESQVQNTAAMLGIDSGTVFPVSAQKALLAKIRGDEALLARSQLETLEGYLSDTILPARESIVRDSIVREMGALLDDHQGLLSTRLQHTTKQLTELGSLSGKNADVITHLMQRTREEQTTYQRNVESFQASRRLLQRQAAALLQTLNLDSIDNLINRTRDAMSGSWTTAGLKKGMKMFFDGTRDVMDQVKEQAEQTSSLVLAIYKKFHLEHGLPDMNPRLFAIGEYMDRMNELYEEAEAFRNSPVTTMTGQGMVIKKFFIHLVSQARNVFFKANQEADTWLKKVMSPLVAQIKEHKQLMERRLKTLRKISESRETLDAKISELEAEESRIKEHLATLQSIRVRLSQPIPFETSSAA